MRKIILLSTLLFTSLSAAFSQTQDVFVPIGKYMQRGDSDKLSVWFASNLELDILGNISDCSKVQATQIMKDFFVNYTPKTFSIIHKSGKPPMTYAIGTLNAGGEKFRITLFVKTSDAGNQIQQLRIEREE
jgi:Ni,Fe-hydrogenase III component G